MANSVYVPNAIWWAQWQLLGGPRRIISMAVVYATVAVSAAFGLRYIDRNTPITTYCDAVIWAASGIQLLLIVMGGTSAVFRAVSRDVRTRMLESHRISPISSAGAVIGYAVGANLQILILYAIGVVFGSVVIRWGTIGVENWICGNLYLLVVAFSGWIATVLLGIVGKKPINPTGILFLSFIMSWGLFLAPGFALLSGIFAGYVGYHWMNGDRIVSVPAALILLMACIFMTVVWGRAAMRKYHRPDLPAFGTLRAVGLLLIWLLACGTGAVMMKSQSLQSALDFFDRGVFRILPTFSAGASMIVAMLPIGSAAHARWRICRGGRPEYPGDAFPPLTTPLICATLVTAFHFILFYVLIQSFERLDIVIELAALFCAFVAAEGIQLFAHGRHWSVMRLSVIFVIVFWAAPPILDAGYREFTAATMDLYPVPAPTYFFAFSPIGTLLQLHDELGARIAPGLVFQAVVATFFWTLGIRSVHRLNHRTDDIAT